MQGISPIQPLFTKIRLENIGKYSSLRENSLRRRAGTFFARAGNQFARAGNFAQKRSTRPGASDGVKVIFVEDKKIINAIFAFRLAGTPAAIAGRARPTPCGFKA
jgi:hypothetical protein